MLPEALAKALALLEGELAALEARLQREREYLSALSPCTGGRRGVARTTAPGAPTGLIRTWRRASGTASLEALRTVSC
ncbi:hypothetical protein [Thermus islandicus]|uniref:hypothetical protein n=1 Tax=Thermus islandicus TaxID=540988 RepID=UPI0003B3E0F5|nr:hypothetical protein [Thermus islandicus]